MHVNPRRAKVPAVHIHKYVSTLRAPKMTLRRYGFTMVLAPSFINKITIENEAITAKKVMNAEIHTIIPLLETINVHLFCVNIVKQETFVDFWKSYFESLMKVEYLAEIQSKIHKLPISY
jgi:hypothetical protein